MAPGRSGGPSEEEPGPATTGKFLPTAQKFPPSPTRVPPLAAPWCVPAPRSPLPHAVCLACQALFPWANSSPGPSSLHLGPLGRPLSPSCQARVLQVSGRRRDVTTGRTV